MTFFTICSFLMWGVAIAEVISFIHWVRKTPLHGVALQREGEYRLDLILITCGIAAMLMLPYIGGVLL